MSDPNATIELTKGKLMTKYEMLDELKEVLVRNWNADEALETQIALGDNTFEIYYKNTLETMVTKEVVADWIQYFEKKLGA